MLIGLVSDIHANLPALEAVLRDMGEVERTLCLGDFVGYGPWPNECVAVLRERGTRAIAGNHDLAAVGVLSTEDFNPDAARAAAWTADQLSPETRKYLESLPPLDEVDGITLAHGSPREPVWEYLLSTDAAAISFSQFSTALCIVGHSHVPCVFVAHPEQGAVGAYADPGTQLTLSGIRAIVNPGSVGQPRDRDPRAAYALYDSETASIEWRRVEYDVEVTQRHILDAGLPRYLADRLSRGA